MAVSNEQFLFCCIDHSNGGTVDWAKVAELCNIPSKGAAAIKYRRLKEKHGAVVPTTEDGSPAPAAAKATPKKTKKAASDTLQSKKRKVKNEDNEEAKADTDNIKAELNEDST